MYRNKTLFVKLELLKIGLELTTKNIKYIEANLRRKGYSEEKITDHLHNYFDNLKNYLEELEKFGIKLSDKQTAEIKSYYKIINKVIQEVETLKKKHEEEQKRQQEEEKRQQEEQKRQQEEQKRQQEERKIKELQELDIERAFTFNQFINILKELKALDPEEFNKKLFDVEDVYTIKQRAEHNKISIKDYIDYILDLVNTEINENQEALLIEEDIASLKQQAKNAGIPITEYITKVLHLLTGESGQNVAHNDDQELFSKEYIVGLYNRAKFFGYSISEYINKILDLVNTEINENLLNNDNQETFSASQNIAQNQPKINNVNIAPIPREANQSETNNNNVGGHNINHLISHQR